MIDILPDDILKIVNQYMFKKTQDTLIFKHRCNIRQNKKKCNCFKEFIKINKVKCLTPYRIK